MLGYWTRIDAKQACKILHGRTYIKFGRSSRKKRTIFAGVSTLLTDWDHNIVIIVLTQDVIELCIS